MQTLQAESRSLFNRATVSTQIGLMVLGFILIGLSLHFRKKAEAIAFFQSLNLLHREDINPSKKPRLVKPANALPVTIEVVARPQLFP